MSAEVQSHPAYSSSSGLFMVTGAQGPRPPTRLPQVQSQLHGLLHLAGESSLMCACGALKKWSCYLKMDLAKTSLHLKVTQSSGKRKSQVQPQTLLTNQFTTPSLDLHECPLPLWSHTTGSGRLRLISVFLTFTLCLSFPPRSWCSESQDLQGNRRCSSPVSPLSGMESVLWSVTANTFNSVTLWKTVFENLPGFQRALLSCLQC